MSEADQGPGGLSLGGALSVGHEDERPHSRDSFPPTKGMAVRPPYLVEGDIFPERGRRAFGKKENQKNFSFSSLQYRISVLKCESVTGSDPWGLLKELEDT